MVIGGGPAGLAAALRLLEVGVAVEVLEADDRPGGRARVERVGDWRFDRGAEFVASFYPRTLALARSLGLGPKLRNVPLRGALVLDGRRHPMPFSPGAFLRSPLISFRSKLRVMGLGGSLAFQRSRLRWAALERGAPLDDESAESFFTRKVGADYVNVMLKATLESLALQPTAEVSRVIALSQAVEAAGSSLVCPAGGVGEIWDEAARRVTVRTNLRVASVERSGAGVRVRLANGEAVEAGAAIVATEASAAAAILPPDAPEQPVAAAARYSAAVKLNLCLERPWPVAEPVCPAGAGAHPLAGIGVLEAKGSDQVPVGKGGLGICASPSASLGLLHRSDEDVRSQLFADAERLLGARIEGVVGSGIVRLREGVPLFAVGWLRRLASLRESLRPSPIAVAGDYLASPSLEGAVRTGQEAADRVAAWLAAHPPGFRPTP